MRESSTESARAVGRGLLRVGESAPLLRERAFVEFVPYGFQANGGGAVRAKSQTWSEGVCVGAGYCVQPKPGSQPFRGWLAGTSKSMA